jgi:predicted RNA-binding protein YlxR (DUF448 family)
MSKEILRKCQGCLKLINRNELIKITKLANGKLKLNPNSKELGRSVYVCQNSECIKQFIKKKKLKVALKSSDISENEKIEALLKTYIK